MNITWRKLILNSLLLLCLPLVISGCGDDDDGGGGGGTTAITGKAVKGPIKGARVTVNRVTAAGASGGVLGTATSGSDGSFSIPIATSQASGPLLITVTGQAFATYSSETKGSGVPFSAAESFNAVIDSATANQNVTVSPLTEAAFKKLPQILAAKPGAASDDKLRSSILAANARIGSLFGIGNILADPATDTTYRAALIIIDQMIEDSKTGAVTDTSAVMTLINNGFTNVGQPAYQTYLQDFNTAADKVKAANPGAIAVAVDSIKTRTAAPPPEIDFNDTSPPTVPANLSATTSAINTSTSSVTLTWSPSTDNIGVAGYEVFRNGSKIATVITATYTDHTATTNVSYSYTVTAFDAAGNRSAASSPLPVTPNPANLNISISGQINPGLQ